MNKFKTSICMDGVEYDNVEVTVYFEPADPESGYMKDLWEVESIYHNGVDITSKASLVQKTRLCNDFKSNMEAHDVSMVGGLS